MKEAIIGAVGAVVGAIIGAIGVIIAANIQSPNWECFDPQPAILTVQEKPYIFYDSNKAQVIVCQESGKRATATRIIYDGKYTDRFHSSSSCKLVEGKKVGAIFKNARLEDKDKDNEVRLKFTVCPL